ARLDPESGLPDSFDARLIGNYYDVVGISSIALQGDGNILVGGEFTNIGGQSRNSMARLDRQSGLADSFDPNPNDEVTSIVVQANGKILVGGDFTVFSPNEGVMVNRKRI